MFSSCWDQLRDSSVIVVCFVLGGAFFYTDFLGEIWGFLINVDVPLGAVHFSTVDRAV